MTFNSARALIPSLFSMFVSRPDEATVQRAISNPARILLIKQSERLGNVLLMNSAINGLKAAFPETRIDMLAAEQYRELLRRYTVLHDVIPLSRKEFIIKPWKLAGLLRLLKKRHYDIAIDCSDVNSHSSTGTAYTLLAGAKISAGWTRHNGRPIYDIEVPRTDGVIHAAAMYTHLMEGIFRTKIAGKPGLSLAAKEKSEGRITIGINCGGRGSKRWPLTNFIELGERLAVDGVHVDFIMGPDERNLRAEISVNLPHNCRLLPLMPLEKLAEVIQTCSLFISSDTGPMHLAWCLNIPVLAIFTDSELEKFRPLSAGSMAVNAKNGMTTEDLYQHALRIIKLKEISQ